MRTVSLVIPTYNRGARLTDTVQRVLACDPGADHQLEVVVIDDGSTIPATSHLVGLGPPRRCTLRVLRQSNSGPARARNHGFRVTGGDVVLFVDDDILAPPDLVMAHLRAHEARPGSVICGRCPWRPPPTEGALFRLLGRLGHDAGAGQQGEFLEIRIVASGQISVERGMFQDGESVYCETLATPAAEEYELSVRLQRRGIRAFLGSRIEALHDSSVALDALCHQQYKHGVGCGEAARVTPETLELPELAAIVEASKGSRRDTPVAMLRKSLRLPLTGSLPRGGLLSLARKLESAAPQADWATPLYKVLIGLFFTAGVREGLRRYEAA